MHHFNKKKASSLWPTKSCSHNSMREWTRWKRQPQLFYTNCNGAMNMNGCYLYVSHFLFLSRFMRIYLSSTRSRSFCCKFCLACIQLPWISVNLVVPIVSLNFARFLCFFLFCAHRTLIELRAKMKVEFEMTFEITRNKHFRFNSSFLFVWKIRRNELACRACELCITRKNATMTS